MSDERAMMPISATRREVGLQPETVSRVLHSLSEQVGDLAGEMAARGTDLVLASGSGDSWFAAQAVRLAFERYAGLTYEPLQAYEYASYGRPGETKQSAHIVLSSSGRPTTTWDALDRAIASGALVIGLTDRNEPTNPFVSRPDHALVPGAEKEGWPAQPTTAAIAVLIDLAIELGRARGHLASEDASRLAGKLRRVPEQMVGVLQSSAAWATALVPELADRRLYLLVGGGPSYAVAQNGSALLAEGPQEVGLALPVEEFHHALRVATLAKGDPVILIAPAGTTDSRSRDTARSLKAWGARLIALVSGEMQDVLSDGSDGLVLPNVDEAMSPLLTLLPLQMLSIELAAQKVAGGYHRPERVP